MNVFDWPARLGVSQTVARRNAHMACIVLAKRRREREDVERFLLSLDRLSTEDDDHGRSAVK